MTKDNDEITSQSDKQQTIPWGKAIFIGGVVWFVTLFLLLYTNAFEPGYDSLSPGRILLPFMAAFAAIYIVINPKETAMRVRETAVRAVASAKKTSRVAEEVLKEADKRVGLKKEIKTEEDAYERAAEELEEEIQNKGIWAKAFSGADGDEQKQKALYIKYRAEQLIKNIG